MYKRVIRRLFHALGLDIHKRAAKPDEQATIAKGKHLARQISRDLKVLNGPFRGLQYPSLDITEATLVSKIVGSYESQLHPIINAAIKANYTDVLDIGSAEGYYGVGFARSVPAAIVHCYDINERDLEFSRQMADLNGVKNITYNRFCDPEVLMRFPYKTRTLIISDCEGYELDLFTDTVIAVLARNRVDVLVELHDILIPGISATLITRFLKTHDVEVIDNQNIDHSVWEGLESISEEDRRHAVYEHRGGINQNVFMQWAWFVAKASR